VAASSGDEIQRICSKKGIADRTTGWTILPSPSQQQESIASWCQHNNNNHILILLLIKSSERKKNSENTFVLSFVSQHRTLNAVTDSENTANKITHRDSHIDQITRQSVNQSINQNTFEVSKVASKVDMNNGWDYIHCGQCLCERLKGYKWKSSGCCPSPKLPSPNFLLHPVTYWYSFLVCFQSFTEKKTVCI